MPHLIYSISYRFEIECQNSHGVSVQFFVSCFQFSNMTLARPYFINMPNTIVVLINVRFQVFYYLYIF